MNNKICLLLFGITLISGCSSTPIQRDDEASYEPAYPVEIEETSTNEGSIYHAGRSVGLFEDMRARRVGDILNIVLTEKTDAKKTAATTTSKDDAIAIGAPTIFGRGVTYGGREIGTIGIDAQRDFAGSGDSKQSNSLSGNISVTVVRVLSNGNLMVRGQKSLGINQGEEYIRVSGIIRQADIRTDNSVLSTMLADAKITYSGDGVVADVNKMGWLSRIFNSKWWPL
ncbi:MAG: flagellar basal body L-ring protein FlgH [Gammaproteobacteria bacterium]|nr:flagellar basal body L-ring protein FlgH [Gammaproteobacteria bacterium]